MPRREPIPVSRLHQIQWDIPDRAIAPSRQSKSVVFSSAVGCSYAGCNLSQAHNDCGMQRLEIELRELDSIFWTNCRILHATL